MAQNIKCKTSLTKQEASKLAEALKVLENRELDSIGYLRGSTQGLLNKFKPILKEVGYGSNS